mmetsp:Transcript_26197/g.98640  ORF Transcript_26197/g.98640 Transcript_26197/m.98640 type:complete len:229 (-) Transcript_26197:584-1270(-)
MRHQRQLRLPAEVGRRLGGPHLPRPQSAASRLWGRRPPQPPPPRPQRPPPRPPPARATSKPLPSRPTPCRRARWPRTRSPLLQPLPPRGRCPGRGSAGSARCLMPTRCAAAAPAPGTGMRSPRCCGTPPSPPSASWQSFPSRPLPRSRASSAVCPPSCRACPGACARACCCPACSRRSSSARPRAAARPFSRPCWPSAPACPGTSTERVSRPRWSASSPRVTAPRACS